MPEILIQSPTAECVHLDEAKAHLRVTDTAQDSIIETLIGGARQAAETKTRQQLMHARWKLVLDFFPHAIKLPHSPTVRVVKIEYVDLGGTIQTMPDTDYVLNNAMMPAIVTPKFGKIWPIPIPQTGAVMVTYDAGYASPITIPNASAGTFTVDGPVDWQVGQVVQFFNSGGALPAPLKARANYTVASAAGNSYTLTDSAGNAVVFADKGTANSYIGVIPEGLRNWIKIRMGSLYDNREEVAILSRGVIAELPFMEGLLDPYRCGLPE